MFSADVLTFREFVMHEPLLLSTIHGAVLEFLRDRDDAVLFGAQAVNAYVSEPGMTEDVDLMSPRATELSQELREYLSQRFHMAVRVREVAGGRGYRLYQEQKWSGCGPLAHRRKSTPPGRRSSTPRFNLPPKRTSLDNRCLPFEGSVLLLSGPTLSAEG
jgi:hypothetical protein